MITGDLLGVPGHVTYDRDMLFGFQMSPAAQSPAPLRLRGCADRDEGSWR